MKRRSFNLSALATAAVVASPLPALAQRGRTSVTLGMKTQFAFGATVVVGLSGAICAPLAGSLSDRVGRKPVMLVPWIALALAVFPCFELLEHQRTALALYTASAILAICSTLASSVFFVVIAESLPQRVRSGALGLIYALAVSVFGGSAQFTVAWLTQLTGSPMTPAWYMIGGVVVGLVAMYAIPETAPIKRKGAASPGEEQAA